MSEIPVPKEVPYCGVCSLPVEVYITYAPAKCKSWLRSSDPELFAIQFPEEAKPAIDAALKESTDILEKTNLEDVDSDGNKHQSRGGKAMVRDESKKVEKEDKKRQKCKVIITLVERTKRKRVTHIRGMENFGLDLKAVAKRCASKYACGCAVVQNPAGFDEIVIQGDFVDDLVDFIPEEWSVIPDEKVEVDVK